MNYASIFDTLAPADLGLPPKFAKWRACQREALDWLNTDCAQSVNAALLPTGAGKTGIAVALARLLGVKAVYLVATKALQAQVLADGYEGMVDIRGRANYRCPNYGNCDAGYDNDCSVRSTSGCAYANAVERARNSRLVITNYAYWLHARKHNAWALENEYEPIGLLICDEAHALESQLAGFASVKIYASERKKFHPVSQSGTILTSQLEDPQYDWVAWAQSKVALLDGTTDDDEKDLLDRCKRIVKMSANPSNWVWQFDDHGHVTFEPIRLQGYTRGLFSGVPRVLLMSASLNTFTMRLLMRQDDLYDYRAWPQVFNPANSPVYHIPTVKLSWRSTDDDYKKVIEAADAIMDNRADRKGIIHTVSYARTKRALQYSRHRGRFTFNEDSQGLSRSLERFRAADPGAVLVTPSVEEGFDFPDAQCEYQIVLKFPFPNETQRVIKERCAQIPGYRLHYAAQKIVQMRGRPVRSENDRAECFVLDNAVRQLCGPEGRSYCPPGFRIFTVSSVPPAPPRINHNQ